MATLQSTITYIQTELAKVSSIRAAPQYPPEQLNVFPIAVCFPRSGRFEPRSSGWSQQFHDIVVQIHVARKDLARDVAAFSGIPEAIAAALLADPTLGGNVSTFQKISYTFGELGWGGAQTIGFSFVIEGVKINA